ncbi:methyltransferase domain-containing protein [Streptomyces spectabilis]|uniref:methyltransferase domain-containing protein n=1 Tax=Streptomyces spectabilis TaxID=68270 RepID=UPI0033E4C635
MNWKPLARGLADALKASRDLVSPHWCEAFARTPRHCFVPAYYRNQGGAPTVWRRLEEADGEEWLRPVYTNATLVTRLDPAGRVQAEGGWVGVPVSSSTQPSLTARMLEALGVEPGDEVLDAGLGTGYQAALLCHRLRDSRQLTAVDLDRDGVEEARRRLEGLGYRPTAVPGDATTHQIERSFQRVVVTFGLPKVTEALRAAVAPGGRLIANVMSPLSYGLAVLDALPDGSLQGRFHPDGGAFMPARHPPSGSVREREADLGGLREGVADVPPEAFDSYHFTFLLAARLPGVGLQRGTDDGHAMCRLVLPGGAWAEVVYRKGERAVFRERGGRDIWAVVEDAWGWFTGHGSPSWGSFGLTVTPDAHRLWFEEPGRTVAVF